MASKGLESSMYQVAQNFIDGNYFALPQKPLFAIPVVMLSLLSNYQRIKNNLKISVKMFGELKHKVLPLTYKLINNLKFKGMKYDVRIVIYGTNKDTQIETKMCFIPRIGDIIESELFRNKFEYIDGKAFEVEGIRHIYNDDLSEIDYIQIELRSTI